MTSLCPHTRRQFMRVIMVDGRTHVVETCLDCGGNARGSGVWVPQHQLSVALDNLPIQSDHRPSPDAPKQGGLFG